MKKKILPLALAAAAGLTGVTAQAQMFMNNNGTGQLLMYPIYTANGGNDTAINVANTTSDYKVVKVRFSDAMNTQDSLDFHLYLSPQDHWSGVVTKNADTGGAQVITGDTSCTIPTTFAAAKPGVTGTPGQMSTIKYREGGAEADGKNNGIDRTLEGHVEVIEMASITSATLTAAKALAKTATTAAPQAEAVALVAMAANIKHKAGVPGDCAAVTAGWASSGVFNTGGTLEDSLDAPTGGLYGYGVIINVPGGSAAMFDAVAVDGFMANDYHVAPGDDEPGIDDGRNTALVNLANGTTAVFTANPNANNVHTNDDPSVKVAATETSEFHVSSTAGLTGSTLAGGGNGNQAGSKEALSALLMRTSLSNDYVLEPLVDAATDWVITFPTKRDFVNFPAYTDNTTAATAAETKASQFKVEAPFASLWDHAKTQSCEKVSITYVDREEAVNVVAPTDIGFSPKPLDPAATDTVICTEVNIINFNGKGVLGGSERITTNTPLAAGFNNGWANLSFIGGGELASTDYATTPAVDPADPDVQTAGVLTKGLPVIGFAIQRYVNGTAGGAGVLANYAGSIGHHYTSANTYVAP